MNTESRQKLGTLRDIMRVIREVNPEFPSQHVETLLIVASKPGINQVQIAEAIHMTPTGASRIIAMKLQDRYGLVKQVPSSEDNRVKNIYLTEKGERFIQKLQAQLG